MSRRDRLRLVLAIFGGLALVVLLAWGRYEFRRSQARALQERLALWMKDVINANDVTVLGSVAPPPEGAGSAGVEARLHTKAQKSIRFQCWFDIPLVGPLRPLRLKLVEEGQRVLDPADPLRQSPDLKTVTLRPELFLENQAVSLKEYLPDAFTVADEPS